MGPLQNEPNQSATAVEPQHGIANDEKSSTTQQPIEGITILSSSKNPNNSFSHNCSSPDTPLNNPFIESDDSSKSISRNLVATESPSTQVMERTTNEPYRIPPSVFATDKSRKETEWSVASNESLFSIHMSFSRDEFLMNAEGIGEGGEEAHEAPTAGLSPVTSSSKITELTKGKLDQAETSMREFLRDSKDQNHEKCYVEERTSRCSDDSGGTSGRSFAFPILTGETEKEASTKKSPEKEKKQPQPSPLPKQEETKSSQTPQAEQPPKRWFSRLFCCSFCYQEKSPS